MTYSIDELMETIRYSEEYGWYVDEARKLAWLVVNVGDFIDHEEILAGSLGKLYAFNSPNYIFGHSQKEPPIQTIRNSRYVWSVRMYNHSGISLAPSYSASYQHYDSWDSRQIGYHIVTLTDIHGWMPKSRWNKMGKSEQDEWVKQRVKEWYDAYNSWINGDVYVVTAYRLPDDIYRRYKKYGLSALIRGELNDLELEINSLWFYGNELKQVQEWMDKLIAKIDAENSQVGA